MISQLEDLYLSTTCITKYRVCVHFEERRERILSFIAFKEADRALLRSPLNILNTNYCLIINGHCRINHIRNSIIFSLYIYGI